MSAQAQQITASAGELRDYPGRPMDLAVARAIDHLDRYCPAFIARSRFLTRGTAAPDGRGDVSPRGDGAGFVHVRDNALLEKAAVKRRRPKIGIRVTVDAACLHCAKAIRRARVWDEQSKHARSALPSPGKMVLEQTAEVPPSAEVDTWIEANYRTEMY